MSVAEKSRSGVEALDALPAFDAEYLFDDPADPGEVTVFSTADADDITTAWITVDIEHAVPLEDAR